MPDLTLVIGNKNYSSWSLRPWVFLKQNRIEFEEKRVALFTETTAKELSQYGSDSKVPVLKDGDLIVWDSLSILEYVSENYLDSRGWPDEPVARGTAGRNSRTFSCQTRQNVKSKESKCCGGSVERRLVRKATGYSENIP
jgi:glutathione S-transferase